MIAKPPPSPPGVARKPDRVELRMANLRRELDAETEPSVRAAVLYHMASLYEHELGRPDLALAHYERAHDAAPEFDPAAIARIRIAERGGSGIDAAGVCAMRLDSAREPVAVASALVDLALQSEDSASTLREALAQSPDPSLAALLLEWSADAQQDPDALRDALRAQAEHATDPALRASLWLDFALVEIEHGDIDLALDALELACEHEGIVWQARTLQRRTAREHAQWDALARASSSMAALLRTEAPTDPLSCSIPDDERLPLAAFLLQEAAGVCALELNDTQAASMHLDAAISLAPEDRVLRLQALLLAERSGDDDAMSRASDWFAQWAPDDPAFVAYVLRRASSTAAESSLDLLEEIQDRHPESAYARAALDVALLRGGRDEERVRRLLSQAEASQGETRAQLLWHAARLAAGGSSASQDPQSLYTEAANCSESHKTPILRDALASAVRAADPGSVLARCHDLRSENIDAKERALLALVEYDTTQHTLRDGEAAGRLLRDALSDPSCQSWAPHVARARAALTDDPELLAEAHELLASYADGETEARHLCAAGAAHARRRDWSSAERVLRSALRSAQQDGYVTHALEAVLRSAGKPEDIVALARAGAGAPGEASVDEHSLLLTGATAERDGNLVAARHAYEQALGQYPQSASAALALLDVARREEDDATRRRAYQSLCDGALQEGVPELFSLLHADSLPLTDPKAAALYERSLDHAVAALPAAVALLASPTRLTTEDQRTAAEEILADAGIQPSQVGNGFGPIYATLRGALGEPRASTGDAWIELADRAPTDELRAAALLHGLRDIRINRGEHALDDLFMVAQGSEDLASSQAAAAIAMDEVLAPGDEPELRVTNLQRKLAHTTTLGRSALGAAHARALVEADRGEEAVALLSNAVDERPDDLALWETIRLAARQAGEWSLVAQACERLAAFVDGSLRADLLEEAGAVRLDCLGQHQLAEDLFRNALEADPTRDVAFRRLHDLLAEREDAEALEGLVTARLELGGPKDRPELLYERARLLRGFSDRPGALATLDELFTAEPDHVGALALAAEVHVSLEQWAEAVDCLRRLSKSEIPDEQRRVAHLGAADFLETRLDAKAEALAELRAVEELGLADADTWIRIGHFEEGFGDLEAALEAYQHVLAEDPTHEAAIARVVELTEASDRDAALSKYERAIWTRIDAGELDDDLLEALRRSAHWFGDLDRAMAVAAVQAAVEPGSPPIQGATDLSHVSMASIWDRDSATIVEEVLQRAAPSISNDRARAKKLRPSDPVYGELERLTERFGARLGSVSTPAQSVGIGAYRGRDGEVHWVVPSGARDGLDAMERFVAGRLAWAVPRGAGALIEESSERAAGILAAVLRAARCPVGTHGPVLPAVTVKLRRAIRKSVQEVAGNTELQPSELLEVTRRAHRSADRAGLLASGDIAAALTTLCAGRASTTALQSSPRALDILRFWCAADSPLWGNDV